VALRDITKQLNLENVVGDKVFGSFAEHLSFLLASLKTGDSTSKPIIFILDQFDSFCSHKNQTLLYNLFDVAQSKAVPITVVGISSSIDVTELLEKRVKSRFSHRHLYIWPLDKLDMFLNMMSSLLVLESEEFAGWNKSSRDFIAQKSVIKFVDQKIYNVDNSIRNLKKVLYQALVKMVQSGSSQLQMEHLQYALESTNNMEVNSMTNQLRDLSITELCLLIAIKHIEQIYDNEPFNFEMVYHEFVKFKRRKYSTLPDERSVVSKCWEKLLELELVSPRGGTGRSQGGIREQFSLHTGQVPPAVLGQAVEKYPHCPTEVIQWLSSSHHTASH
jgi:origin recognition complex subunit 4